MGNHAADDIVRTIEEAFPPSGQLCEQHDPAKIEHVMRPFSPVSDETSDQIRNVLMTQDRLGLSLHIGSWLEADVVVNGNDARAERRIQFLLSDTCSCVLQYLPEAFKHAVQPIDPRIQALIENSQA